MRPRRWAAAPRPGRSKGARKSASKRKATAEAEARARDKELVREIGERCTLKLIRMAENRVDAHSEAERIIRRELGKRTPKIPDWKLVEQARLDLLSNFDIRNFLAEFNDRFGFPRRSASEVSMTGAPPLLVELQLTWPAMAPAGATDADDPPPGVDGPREAGA